MKKRKPWLKAIIQRRLLVIILLLLQIASILFLLTSSSKASAIIQFSLTILSFVVVFYIISKKGKAANKLTWIIIILTFPIFGGLLYIIIRFQYSNRSLRRLHHLISDKLYQLIKPQKDRLPEVVSQFPDSRVTAQYLQNYSGFPVYNNTETEYLCPGEVFYKRLIEELNKAEKYIFMEFFIVSEGEMLDSIIEIIKKKVAQGVEVRFMYDDIGCFLTLPKDYSKTLAEIGVKCLVFNPFRPILSAIQNNRDHRKIVSIDGKVAFTGGINIADEYINKIEKHGHWRDAGIALYGDAAWGFTVTFLQLWDAVSRTSEYYSEFMPPRIPYNQKLENQFVQPYSDSPMDTENVGEHVYMQIINNAKKYLYISTPYLIIDDSMLSALSLAAKSGIDVRIMTPQKWDKIFVHLTSRSYYRDLLKAGVKIYEYKNGFNHAKTFVADDTVATVGTTNLDFRSLYLHFECGVCLYGTSTVADIKNNFIKTLDACKEITLQDCKCSAFIRILQEILRVFAPLM